MDISVQEVADIQEHDNTMNHMMIQDNDTLVKVMGKNVLLIRRI